jgi:hypothetical protein
MQRAGNSACLRMAETVKSCRNGGLGEFPDLKAGRWDKRKIMRGDGGADLSSGVEEVRDWSVGARTESPGSQSR